MFRNSKREAPTAKRIGNWIRSAFFLLSIICIPFRSGAQEITGLIQPDGITLAPFQMQQFTAPIQGQNVTWWVKPLGTGTISQSGLYTAPATAGVVYIHAMAEGGPNYVTTVYLSGVASGGTAPSSVSIGVFPASLYLQPGQSGQFTATVQGTANQQVQWSLNPNVGSIVNGFYTAPFSLASDLQVTISATSFADPTKTATATVMVGQPVSATPTVNVSLMASGQASGSTTLSAGQSEQFTATVTGSSNTAVNWALTPNVGSVSNGLYTAPGILSAQQAVLLTAISQADPSQSASVWLMLVPAVGLSLSPGSASLTGGQSVALTAQVTGTLNTAVMWSFSPQIGTLTNGVYQAPAIIPSAATITVTATSVADSTKSGTATLSLQPAGVTVAPATASLSAGQSAAFAATVAGSGNPAVVWSLNPAVGALVNGVYTAPATIGTAQTVTVTAASVLDPTKTATAIVTLTPNANSTKATNVTNTGTVTLPIEVLGPNGTTATVSVNIPSHASLSGPLRLWMRIHGLRAETQASVQVNNSAWMPINSSSVTLWGNAAAYGGIGGGFSTLKMVMDLPAGLIQAGENTFSFRFNQTDGRVSGFRVLSFNLLGPGGSVLVPLSNFVLDEPNKWQPPSTNPADIAAGQTLWQSASLITPLATGGTKTILAHCSDCHTQDGRDLKYFNYSNNSIEARSAFHGLTQQQGIQIASYIRSLNVVNPGRPWNPPYQPGPGLDSQPVSNWAAGAGANEVLGTDQEMIDAIFPSGIQASSFDPAARLNQRELPLTVQLPDWNQWLPGTHPMDAFGAAFSSNGYNTIYQTLRSSLQVNDPAAYVAQNMTFQNWFGAFYGLLNQVGPPIWNNNGWTPATVDAIYSLPQWGMVKTWEMMNQFQLEGYSQNIFGPQADPRAWYSNLPFFMSPHELKMPNAGPPGLRNGSAAVYTYLSYVWYNVQLILNDSNGTQSYQYPIDWGYAYDFVEGMGTLLAPQGGIETMWMIKGLEAMQQLGKGPQYAGNGWQPFVVQPSWLVTPEWNLNVWTGVDPAARAAIANGIVSAWLSEVQKFTPAQFYAGGWTTPTTLPVAGGNAYDNVFSDWVWYMIPRFTFIGVNQSVVSQLAQWAQTVWPLGNWTADLNATCSWSINPPDDPPNFLIGCSQ
jgi:hypothetical protein